MLLTITNHTPDARDLGWLLHKHPDRVQRFELAFGAAQVLYPEASTQRCTAALLLEVDPVGLVRSRGGGPGSIDQYVNDRPYAATSLLSVAIARVLGTALGARCKDRPELIEKPLALQAKLAAVPARSGGGELIGRLFEPLGYTVETERQPLDERFPEWGGGPYHTVTLAAERPLYELLNHLYVLIPVLDNAKHYWIGADETEKLLKRGEGWLADHPDRELIVNRYLRYLRPLTREALGRLSEEDEADPDAAAAAHAEQERAIEQPLSLNEQRHASVLAAVKASGAHSVADLGCGEGRLLRRLMAEPRFERIVGLDVSLRSLEEAERRLKLDRLPEPQRRRIELMHGSLMYRDRRFRGLDTACLVEVIEHLDEPRLAAMERAVFEAAQPGTVVVTTPNVEYNVRFESLPAGRLRHRDHRFEWTRQQFREWAEGVAERFGYTVRFLPVGPDDPEVGPPTQMGVFERAGGTVAE